MAPGDFDAWSVADANGDVTVFLHGDLDLVAADRARTVLLSAVRRDGGDLVVDLSGLRFLDATGVRALMSGQLAASVAGQTVRLVGAHGLVETVLRLLGLIDAETTA